MGKGLLSRKTVAKKPKKLTMFFTFRFRVFSLYNKIIPKKLKFHFSIIKINNINSVTDTHQCSTLHMKYILGTKIVGSLAKIIHTKPTVSNTHKEKSIFFSQKKKR